MTNNIKLIDLLYFKGKIGNKYIEMIQNSKNNEKCNDFIIWMSMFK